MAPVENTGSVTLRLPHLIATKRYCSLRWRFRNIFVCHLVFMEDCCGIHALLRGSGADPVSPTPRLTSRSPYKGFTPLEVCTMNSIRRVSAMRPCVQSLCTDLGRAAYVFRQITGVVTGNTPELGSSCPGKPSAQQRPHQG